MLQRGRKRKITNREFGTRNSPWGFQFSTRTRSLAHESDVIAVSLATVTTCWYHTCKKIYWNYLARVWNVGRGFFVQQFWSYSLKSTPDYPGFTAKESINDLHFIFSSWHFWVSILNLSTENVMFVYLLQWKKIVMNPATRTVTSTREIKFDVTWSSV